MTLTITCKDGGTQKVVLSETFKTHENGKRKSILEMESVARVTAMDIVTPANYRHHKLDLADKSEEQRYVAGFYLVQDKLNLLKSKSY